MSSLGCFDCGKVNKDEALEEIKQRAKVAAIDNGEAQAVYKDGDEFKYISATYAFTHGYNIISILSQFS